jgi:phosphopantothenoylcysteine decarboxylase/phosphopantothenate--cysteine ligase
MGSSMASNILIGISGSIAAYKMADVVSQLKKQGHQVQCILTESATQFVTPLVLETLSGNPVRSAIFGADISGTEHIDLARWADIFVIAPASANTIAKLSLGLADDLLTTVALATEAPLLIAPAMNTVMWNKPVTQGHLRALADGGARFVDPAAGVLACGEVGVGKLASVESIVLAINAYLSEVQTQDLSGLHVLITSGPTTTPIDAVRYITNHSTGRMGAAMAEAALARGAQVSMVLGVDKGVVRPIAPNGGSRIGNPAAGSGRGRDSGRYGLSRGRAFRKKAEARRCCHCARHGAFRRCPRRTARCCHWPMVSWLCRRDR